MNGLLWRIAGGTGGSATSHAPADLAPLPGSVHYARADAAGGAATDPATTIAAALRGLRFRYIAVTVVLVVLCAAFVGGGHWANARFSNATTMAVLVAQATEATERSGRTALQMAGEAGNAAENTDWTEKTLRVHADMLARVVADMKALWPSLTSDLRARLLVDTPYGRREPIAVLEEFHAELIRTAAGGSAERVASGKYLDGMIGYMVKPALDQEAETLRDVNREMADSLKVSINTIGGFLVLFAAAILFLIFIPMERSIRVALAKLKTAIEGAKSAERAKSEFLANMSHEIRTPMNGVLGMAELMAHTDLDTRQKTFNDVIVKSGNALLTIINDILDFSKIDAGHTELDPAPFNLQEAVEDVATLVSSRVTEKDLEMIVRVDPDLPEWIVGDVGRIRQVLTNLAGNAVKFTEQGHVLIEVSKSGDDILFSVADTGIGIPEDKLPSVFEKFSQVDSSSTRRHEGTGLGLAIASRLIELMDGAVGATSTLGVGSTFWVRFPLVAHEALEPIARADADLSGARILIVDDNAINRDILTELTRKWGFDSCAVDSGALALQFMNAALQMGSKVDLVVLDYQMPGMNGADVLTSIRRNPQMASTPVVLLTSVDHRIAVRELKSAGATAILTKPTRSSLLLNTIMEELHRGGAGLTAEPQHETDAAPVPPRIPAAAAKLVPPAVEAPADGQLDILVAEDNEVNQFVFGQILGQFGHSFQIVGDGRRAVETWRQRRPAIILMDVSMPEMNGFEATMAIRNAEAAEGLARTPIVGVTAHALKGDRERCLEAGMDDYLTKPISPDRMAKKLSEWLSEPHALRA